MKDATVVRQLCPFCPVGVDGGTPDPNWWCGVNRRRAHWVSQSPPNPACGALPPTQARVGSKSGNLPQEGQSILVMKVAKVGLCSMDPSGKGTVNVLEMLVAGEAIGSSFSANF